MALNDIIKQFKTGYNLAKDWRYHDKMITLAGKTVSKDKMTSVITQLDVKTKQLTKKNIDQWRKAEQMAIDIENPKRYNLLAIYDDCMHDLHLKGAIRNRKMAVISKPFKVVDEEGEADTDLTRMLKKRWFKKCISLALDSKFYGHSLIELTDIDRSTPIPFFRTVNLVPRHHVCPEYGVLLKDPSDEPKKGIPYREGLLTKSCIEAGESRDLGELDSIAKEAISKKFVLQFWDNFAEIFGMPIRVGKTSSRDPKDRAQITNMLESMGSAAWGLFPEGSSIEIVGNNQTDSYEVYDKRIERSNSEISKAVLGQTMTMDNGSSKSQAQVHENVADEVAEMDRDFIKDFINDDLFPFLIMHGWPLQNWYFDWDDAREYTPEEMKSIEEMLIGEYDIEPEYFTEKYNIPIIGKKQPQIIDPAFGNTGGEKKNLIHNLPPWVLSMPEK